MYLVNILAFISFSLSCGAKPVSLFIEGKFRFMRQAQIFQRVFCLSFDCIKAQTENSLKNLSLPLEKITPL
jgi:hypothetical protein